jgi:hypothetical protein
MSYCMKSTHTTTARTSTYIKISQSSSTSLSRSLIDADGTGAPRLKSRTATSESLTPRANSR